jgi:MYXO-CTERM domain-containing protein
MRNVSLIFAAAALLAVSGKQAHAVNIVLNGGFETGDFTNWSVNLSSVFPWEVDTSGQGFGNVPFDGTYFASTGCVGLHCITGTPPQQASLSQDLSTTVGDAYTLDFWFGTAYGNPMEVQALFGGAVVEDLPNIGVTPYTEYTVSGLVATSTTTQLEFLGRQDLGFNELDDVSVTDNGPTAPEPAAWLLGLGGLLTLVAARRLVRA